MLSMFCMFSVLHGPPSYRVSNNCHQTHNWSRRHSLPIEEAHLLKRTVTGNMVSRLLKHRVEVTAKVKKAPGEDLKPHSVKLGQHPTTTTW